MWVSLRSTGSCCILLKKITKGPEGFSGAFYFALFLPDHEAG
jgi:hypothetical protein